MEVQISKKCAPLWREAHFEVKMLKTPGVRTTFGGSDWQAQGIVHLVKSEQNVRILSHFQLQPPLHHTTLQLHDTTTTTTTTPSLHSSTLHYTTLHSITLNYITLHYITLHYTPLHYITLHYLPLHFTTLHYTLHSTTLQLQLHNYTPLH